VHIEYQAAAFDLLGDICLVPLLLRRLRPQVRTVTTFHDARIPYLFPRAGGLRRAAIRLLARTSHAVIAADARDLHALGGPSPRHVQLPIGANVACDPPADYDRAAFRARLGFSPGDLALVYFGTFNASKGIALLLDAFARVHAAQPGSRLLLLGGEAGASDPTDRASAMHVRAEVARLGSSAIRTGWLPPEQLSAYLLAGDVALLPFADGASARRGSLLACAEHGLPIVSTIPAGAEVARHVLAVSPDADALAHAVLSVAREPAPYRALSRDLADAVSWPRIAARHVALYEALLYSPE
jgi:glycosyltransferase involved in cell wall biosynthesis